MRMRIELNSKFYYLDYHAHSSFDRSVAFLSFFTIKRLGFLISA